MAEVLCGVCHKVPKKYKCPTCALPYCSLGCFKLHKPTHPESATGLPKSSAPEIEIPQPPVPAPLPKYLRQKIDFSVLATSPKFQELLKKNPALFASLQNIYAATIEPEHNPRSHTRGGRGAGYEGRWTPKQGDNQAMRKLKHIRDGDNGDKDKDAMAEFVTLVDEMFADGKKGDPKEKAST